MTEENETLDFHEFVLKLPDSAWNLSSESLEHAAQLAKEGAMSGLSPWQAASLYSKLTGKKTLATVKDTMALVRDALLRVLQGNAQAAFGWFLNREEHKNVKEFRGALLTIQAYALRDTTLRFLTDSMVLYWYRRKWGGRKPRFNALILQLWNFTQANRIEIQPFYVHTSVNPADIWSRLRWTPSEATFPSDVLTWILEEFKSWIQPEIDWMSRSSKAVCSKFVSPCPQPGAYAIDVFSQNLTLLSPGWVFPPFKHIPQLVNKVLESPGVKVLMALPYRPREVWWNLLMKHVKFAVNTSEFRLQMPDGTETQPRFVLTLAYVCVNTINCEELPTKRRRLSSMKSGRTP